ncbi:MAG TPA: helix-turn-helix transcriptional regulator, partial [Methylocella sp.]
KESIDQLTNPPSVNSLVPEPIIVPRVDKLPVIVRIWPFEGPEHPPALEVRALVTLNALGPRPGPPPAVVAKTFHLTPSEAKLACIIARGAPPFIAARELKISRETARNQLKVVFAKTNTHRQSELVALLMQVG